MSENTRGRWLGGLGLLALLLAGAVWWWLDLSGPQPPARYAAVHAPPPPETSVWTLPVHVDLDDLTRTVEAQVPTELAHVEGEEVRPGWLIDLDLRRPGDVATTARDQTLVVEVPLTLDARTYRSKRADKRAEKGKDGPEGVGVSFSGVLELALDLTLTDDWSLASETELSLRWIDKPTVELGPLRIGIAKPVEKHLEERLAEVAKEIDANLAERNPTRQAVEKAWEKLSAPIELSSDPPVWLVAEPESLFASDLVVGDEGIDLVVGFRGGLQTVLGEPPATTAGPLPARAEPPDELGFHVALPVALGWEQLSRLGTEAVRDRTPEIPGTDLVIDRLELYPSGDQVAVRIDARAAGRSGTIYLVARPDLDRDRREVHLRDFAYVLDSHRLLVGANALAQDRLETWIEEQLAFPFGADVDRAVSRTNDQLREGRPTQDGGSASGTLDELELRALTITETALLLDIRASGTAAIQAVPRPREQKSTTR